MLRLSTSYSADIAGRYFDAALQPGDYYMKGHQAVGRWGGLAAKRLGLVGEVTREQFMALAENRLPTKDGKAICWTLRTNTTRKAPVYDPKSGLPVLDPETGKPVLKDVTNRRVGYDLTFSVPKSVSLYLAETGDQEVERMINRALRRTMESAESRIEARVRKGGERDSRITGNLVYAAFGHRETRPIDGIPDPHWHVHVFVFNGTWDEEERAWKALEVENLAADRTFYEAQFNARLAEELMAAGYGIRRTERDFELASVSRDLIEKFSKRTQLIEQLARERYQILEAEARQTERETGMDFNDAFALAVQRRGGDWAAVKAGLGAQFRESKSRGKFKTWEGLVTNWRDQMTPAERGSLTPEAVKAASCQDLLDPDAAKDGAIRHLYENLSVKRGLHAAAELLRWGIGRVGVPDAEVFPVEDPRFMRASAKLVTTREVWADEQAMVNRAILGMGVYEPLGREGVWEIRDPRIAAGGEQARALQEILANRDLAVYLHGPAGGGKSDLAVEAVPAIEALSGRKVLTLAPSSSAVEELRRRGFARAETFAAFRLSALLQGAAAGQALWVDEASFLPVRDMRWLLDYAAANDCRLVLGGDTRQHHGVERGDAVRILVAAGAVRQITLTQIFRQQVPALRAGIRDLAAGGVGRTQKGFDKLDRCSAILEVTDLAERLAQIVAAHLEAVRAGKTSLIVAPTHAECRQIARAVREALRAEGRIAAEERTFIRLQKLNLSEGQRRDAINYRPGLVIEFNKRAKGGFVVGEQWEVVGVERAGIRARQGNRERLIAYGLAPRFGVYEAEAFSVSEGDTLRFSRSCGPFKNNDLLKVQKLEGGRIHFEGGRSVEAEGRRLHLDQGVAVTSYSGQGKTVDQVIGSAPVSTFAQVNQAMFYVVMSRARFSMRLFTDSKAALREAVCRPSERLSPYEVLMGLTKPKAKPQEHEGMEERVDRLMKAQARDRRQEREDFSARDHDGGPDQDRTLVIEPER